MHSLNKCEAGKESEASLVESQHHPLGAMEKDSAACREGAIHFRSPERWTRDCEQRGGAMTSLGPLGSKPRGTEDRPL